MTIRPGTRSSAFASLLITGALAATAAWAEESGKEPVQVSGAELQAWLSSGFVFAGEDHTQRSVYMVLGKDASQRTMFFSHPVVGMQIVKGSQRVEGNMLCAKWPFAAKEQCREWYRVGENKYEQREKGSRTKLVTVRIVAPSHSPAE